MKWPKDRRKAFLWAAEAFGTPYNRRTKRQKDLTRDGFCYAICELTGSKLIYPWASKVQRKMGKNRLWWWRCIAIYDKERSLFCSLMAELSDKEFEELQDGPQASTEVA